LSEDETMSNQSNPFRLSGIAVAALALAPGFSSMLHAGDFSAPWVENVQSITPDSIEPLEVKTAIDTLEPVTRIGASVLVDDDGENRLDNYIFSADADGVTMESAFIDVARGDVFGLGDVCFSDGDFVVPYIDNFNVHAAGFNLSGSFDIEVAGGTTQHTATDCVVTDDSTFNITALDFDNGEIDAFESLDLGASWSNAFSYKPSDGDIIGGFGGGFVPTAGALPVTMGDDAVGLTYQLDSGPIHSAALRRNDGTLLGPPVSFDAFASHGSFIGNGKLKEMDGLALPGFDHAFGAANGGTHVGFGWIELSSGTPGFQLLNQVTTSEIGFQSVAMAKSDVDTGFHLHVFSNRHTRMAYDTASGSMTFEEIPQYPLADVGGPVSVEAGNDRLYVFATGSFDRSGGAGPGLSVVTMNPDPDVMEGIPLGGAPGGPDSARQIPALGSAGLFALLALVLCLGWLRLRAAGSA
jgi:hypothetical protein